MSKDTPLKTELFQAAVDAWVDGLQQAIHDIKGGEFPDPEGLGAIKDSIKDHIVEIKAAPATAADRDRLKASNTELLLLLNRSIRWLRKGHEKGIHRPCVAPRDLTSTIFQVQAAIAKAEGN